MKYDELIYFLFTYCRLQTCTHLCLFAYALAPILTFKENFGKKNLLKRNYTQTSLRSPAYLDRNSYEKQSTFFVIHWNTWKYNWSRRTTKYEQITDHNTCDNMTIIVLVNRRAKTSFNAENEIYNKAFMIVLFQIKG